MFFTIISLHINNKNNQNIITSRFSSEVNPKNPHPEYPRPQFVRSSNSWMNLNGEWKIQFLNMESEEYGDESIIIVPFSPESFLSGVSRQLLPSETAKYSREFDLTNFFDPKNSHERLLIHFGAIDQKSWIYINGQLVGNNTNGYIPFSFDITSNVLPGINNITVLVQDFSEESLSVTGKQRVDNGGTFYTAQSGIWQTVWLEKVPSLYIQSISVNPIFTPTESYVDFFNISLSGSSLENYQNNLQFKIDIYSSNKLLFSKLSNYNFSSQNCVRFTFPQSEVQPWSPSSPFLYQYNITLIYPNLLEQNDSSLRPKISALKLLNSKEQNSKEQNTKEQSTKEQDTKEQNSQEQSTKEQNTKEQNTKEQNSKEQINQDIISGYFALRSFTKGIDSNGIPRIFLNGEPYFQLGVLDQGYWSDGLMTPPTDSAYEWDIKLLKAMGFNMIREHAKIAPLRFYYHCDRLGMIVWQDMVPGFQAMDQSDHRKAVVRLLRDIPCICTWTLFNQDWGKFEDPAQAVKEVKELDYGNRFIDSYSGGHDDKLGDFVSVHCYSDQIAQKFKDDNSNGRIFVLTEFGGLEHNVYLKKNENSNVYGMFPFRKRYNSEYELRDKYKDLMLSHVFPLVKTKVSATVFTQLSDIEGEMNGFVTYNRKHIKFNIIEMEAIHRKFKFPLEE